MKTVSEKELEHLNALADGELGGHDAAMLKQRLRAEPHLQAAYDDIRQVKRKLGSLSYERAGRNPDRRAKRVLFRWQSLAIGASVAALAAFVVLLSGEFASRTDTPQGAVAWHAHLSAKEYVVRQEEGPLFVSLGQTSDVPVPDLSASRLFLVDLKILGDVPENRRAVAHYRGLRGCRLTMWYGSAGSDPVQWATAGGNTALRQWRVGDGTYALIANGMDRQRFAAIADYVEVLTRLEATREENARTAMADAYANSVRCA